MVTSEVLTLRTLVRFQFPQPAARLKHLKELFTQTVTTGMEAVLGSMDTITSLMSSVWTMMTSNALLTLFLATGLISVGVKVFRMIKSAARR